MSILHSILFTLFLISCTTKYGIRIFSCFLIIVATRCLVIEYPTVVHPVDEFINLIKHTDKDKK